MINEQENKASLDKMSDLEYAKNDTEMMRYRVNGLSNKLGLLGMGASIFAGLVALNSFNPMDFQVLVIVLINVVILLGGFLACERVKTYSTGGAIAQIVFSGVCIARMFYIPLMLVIAYKNYLTAFTVDRADFDKVADYNAKVSETQDGCLNILAATITNKDNSEYAIAFLPQNGYFRSIFIMTLLAIAAGAFLAAGLTGYAKAKKLSTYLASIKAKN
jgi:hypothetical protein